MFTILKKELQSFFSSHIGYLIILVFLILNGLFLWVFRQDFNIFDYGYADLSNFFLLAPWVFLFLVPAVTMRSFSEEKKLGTLELLLIKPITESYLFLGKFMGAFLLCAIAVLPTLIYVFAISDLGTTEGNFDLGVVVGSYLGMLLLIALYTAVGIWCSLLSTNQLVALILGATLCFLVFYGPEAFASLFTDGGTQEWIKNLGGKAHFESSARGILDIRDTIYFLSLICFFLFLSIAQLKSEANIK